MSYTIFQALEYLKWEITQLEMKLKETKLESKRKWIEGSICWMFERGLSMIRMAKDENIKKELLDFFQGRKTKK